MQSIVTIIVRELKSQPAQQHWKVIISRRSAGEKPFHVMPSDTTQPLISCIMPTYNRRTFVPQAIAYFLRQVYDSKELVIVDDGTDRPRELIINERSIMYLDTLPLQQASVGYGQFGTHGSLE